MKKTMLLLFALIWSFMGLFAQTSCQAPTGLMLSAHSPEWRNVQLSWTPVSDNTEQILGWGTTNSSTVSSGNDFTAVIRYETSDLANLSGRSLSAVQFKPGMLQSECNYYIYIWQGGHFNWSDSTLSTGTQVREQFVTQQMVTASLNTVYLDEPLNVDPTQEIWIGVRAVRLVSTGYPIGVSYNNRVSFKGDLIHTATGWRQLTLSSQANVNWYMFGVFTNNDVLLSGYNVYRDNSLLTTVAGPSYVDTLPTDGVYHYDVTAAYANGCESSAISDSVIMNNDCFISTLPFEYNFDRDAGSTATSGANNLPECWSSINTGTSYTNYPIIYSTSSYAASTPNSLRFYIYNTSANNTAYGDQYAILPPVDIQAHPINTLQMDFDARCGSATSTYVFNLEVGVMTSISNPNTFVPIDTIVITGNTTYNNYVVNFENYVGDGQYIAFRAKKQVTGGTNYNSGNIDNIRVDIIQTCPKPTALTVNSSSITENSVELSWTETGQALEWVVEYGPAGFIPGRGTSVTVYNNPVSISDLAASTPYDFYVRSVCSLGDTSYYSSKATASTACGLLSSFPYNQNFDAYTGATSGSSSNLQMTCWKGFNINCTSSTYAGYPIVYNNTTYSNSGANSLRFYGYVSGSTNYGNQYAASPEIDVVNHPINTLQIDFKIRRYSSSYPFTCMVGVMSDSINTFTPVDTIMLTSDDIYNVYQDRTIFFNNYVGDGNRIAFCVLAPSTSYNAGQIDDIIISVASSCLKPTNVTASNIADQSAQISWVPSGDEGAWDISVVEAGQLPDANTAEFVTMNPYTIENLTANTEYDVYVRANCGSEASQWSTVCSFTTRCGATSNIPYAENFDSYPAASAVSSGVIPTCWNRSTNYSSNYPYIYSTNHASGTGCLYFYSTSAYYSMANSQALDLSQYGANELMLKFKAMRTSTTAGYGRLQVGLMTDPDDMSTFTILKNLNTPDYTAAGEWNEFSVILPEQYTQPVYLVFYSPAENSSYVGVDDIVLDVVPDCAAPTNVYVSNIRGADAQINWDAAFVGADSYTVEYSEAGMDSWSSPITVDGTSYVLGDLTPTTAYDVRVTSNCSTGFAEPVTIQLTTTCLIPENVSVGAGTSTSAYLPFYTAYQYSYSQQLYTNAELNNTEMDISTISFQYAGAATVTKNVDIYLSHTLTTNVSSWIPMDNAQLVYSGPVTMRSDASQDGWNTILLDSTFHYNGYSNLLLAVYCHNSISNGSITTDRMFKAHSITGMARYLSNTGTTTYNPLDVSSLTAGTASSTRDNIRFGNCNITTTCAPPTLSVADVTNESVTLTWVPGYQETSWELQYKSSIANEWTSEGAVTSYPYVIGNLTENTDYQIRLAALCGDTSTWSTVSVRTLCASVGVPFTEDFESATGSGAGNFVPCWTRNTNYTTQYPYTSSSTTYTHSGGYGTYFYGSATAYSYAATPRFNDEVAMDSLQIRFWAKKSTATYFLEVGVMTNPNDYSTFELLGRLTPDTTATWQELEINTRGYQGQGHFIAFRLPAEITNYMSIDDILIQYIPGCPRPENVHAENVTSHTADIVFSSNSEASAWYYVYGPADSIDLENAIPEMTTDTVISLSNLNENTEYDIFIMTECFNGEGSEYVQYTFSTMCDPIATLPFMDNFDTYGGSGSAYFPSCWSRYYASSATSLVTNSYPYVYSSSTNTPPGCLYFYNLSSTAGTFSMAVLPEFASTVNISALQLDVNMRTTSLNYYLLVGVMSDPTDLSTFVVVDTLASTATSTYEAKSVLFSSYTGSGKFIALKGNGYVYLDDLVIDYAPACDAPTNIVVSNITQTEATVTWTAGDSESSWEVYVVESGASLSGVTPIIATMEEVTLMNLMAGTTYDVYVRAICPNDAGHSSYTVYTFSTQCYPITDLPFAENFDSYTGATTSLINNLPTCWNNINNGSNATYAGCPTIYSTSSYAQSTPNSLRFYTGTASTYGDQYLILPLIDVASYPINTLQVKLDARKYSTSYDNFKFAVGVITNASDPTTFIAIDTITASDMTYNTFISYLNTFMGTNGRICIKAFKESGNTINAGFIDNLEVSLAPSCFRVGNVDVQNFTQSSVTLNWVVNGNENMWNIEYKLSSDSVWTIETVSDNPATIVGLLPGTSYDFRVQANCGTEFSDYSNVVTVFTECSDMSLLPYTENFDSYTASTSGATVNLPSCWQHLNIGCSSNTYMGYPMMYNSTTYSQSGANSLRFYGYTSGSTTYGDQYAIMRAVDTTTYPIQSLQLKFKARKYSTYPFDLVVGVMSDFRDTSTFVPVQTISPSGTSYEDFTVYFNSYPGGGKYIAMMVHKPSTSYNAGNVDDIELSLAPSCAPVSDLQAALVTTNSIDMVWTSNGNESDWTIEYRSETDDSWSQAFAATTPTVTLTNLLPSTNYLIRVKAVCDGNTESIWSNVAIVRTACEGVSLPFVESFDDVTGTTTGTSNNLPDCWDHLSGTYSSYVGYPIVYNSSSYAYNGNNSLRFYTYTSTSSNYGDQYAILPPVDVTTNPLNTLQLSFKARKYSTSYATFTLVVGVMSSPDNASTFVPVDTLEITDMTYDDYTVFFSNYTGLGNRIALMAPMQTSSTYNSGYVDTLRLETIVGCPAPRNLAATANTTSSITLSWTENGSATQWNVEYGPAGFTQGTGTTVVATANPFTITGLNASTNYSFYVQADCGDDETSLWSNAFTAATSCEPIALPYTEDFEDYAGTAYNEPGVAPLCWTSSTNNTTYPAPHVVGSGTYYYYSSGSKSLVFTASSAGSDAFAVLPEFNQPLNTLHLNFWRAMENVTNGTLTVGYVTSSSNTASFVAVQQITSIVHSGSGGGDTVSVDFTGADIPANGLIAFRWYQNGTFYSCCIDDINVTLADNPGPGTTCDAPTNVAASNIAQTSATITWTPGGDETSWNLQYKAASSSSWSSSITVNNTPSYALTGLTANTAYQVRVQAVCDASNVSDWANGTFTTLNQDEPTCPAPTNVAANNITKNSAVITWNQEPNTASSWTVLYKQTAASAWESATANAMTYALSGLNPETQYDVQVMANCDNGMQSAASETIHFTTAPDGVNDYVLESSISVYPNPTSGQFTISNEQFTISSVDVYDVYGKLISTTKVEDTHVTLDINTYADGVYFARILTDKGVVTKRIVKK